MPKLREALKPWPPRPRGAHFLMGATQGAADGVITIAWKKRQWMQRLRVRIVCDAEMGDPQPSLFGLRSLSDWRGRGRFRE